MPSFLDSIVHVTRGSGVSAGRIRAGLALRLAERAFAVAPFFLGYVWLADTVSGKPLSLPLFGFCLALLLAGQMVCSYLGQLHCFLGAYDLMAGYRERLIDHLGRLPLGFLRGRRAGELAGIVTEDVKRVEDIFTHIAAELAAAVAVPVLFLAALAWVDWRLTLALIVMLPAAAVALGATSRFFLARGRHKQNLLLDASGLIVEFVTGIRTLRLFNRAEPWLERLDRRFDAIRAASLDVEALGAGPIQLYRFCLEIGLAALLLVGAWLAGRGEFDPLVWLLFGLTACKVLEPLIDAAAYLTELRAMTLGEGRIRRLLEEPPLAEGRVDGAELPASFSAPGDVAFRNVSFRYEARWVLREVSFRAERGSMTAIVGPSGAGKSTLLHLLARFFDPQEGAVTLHGVDLRALSLDRLYRSVSVVFQDVQLFDGTLLENVRIGRPEADIDEVLSACNAAFCDAFIERLPEGIHTRIGENGQLLSGGERQRLSIARALLKDAPVLLLDEATASVDPLAQYEIQQGLSRLAQNRTVIAVAHRLSTIRHADEILVLDQGRIAERGTHETLIERNGLYAALWREQHPRHG